MNVALKNLVAERARLITSVLGVGFAVALVLVMVGIFVGTTRQVTTYIDHHSGAVWVMQPGTSQMFRSVSWLPAGTAQRVRGVEGVADAAPILGVPSSFVRDGRHTAFYLVGHEPSARVGGPWKIAEGRGRIRDGEAVLDRVLARKNGVEVGDRVDLVDRSFRVVGLSDETAAVGNFYAFVTMRDATRMLRAGDRVSYLLVTPATGTDSATVAQRIGAEVPGVGALTTEQFADNSRAIVISMIGRPLYAMIAIGLVVGIALVVLTMLATVAEQQHQFGVLKAIGVKTRQLFGVVLVQATLLALVGYALGAAATYAVQFAIRERLGDVTLEVTPAMLGAMAAVTIAMAVLGALAPIRRVARLDPASVFRR